MIAIIATFFLTHALGDSLDIETERLLNAKTQRDLAQTIALTTELSRQKIDCEAQLRSSKPPVSCLLVIQLEMKQNLIEKSRGEILIDGYASTCEERARNETSASFLDAALKEPLPDRCFNALSKRRDELLYIMSARAGMRSGS